MRVFNKRVLEQSLQGTAAVYSDAVYDSLLGLAEWLSFEVVTERAAGTDPTILLWEQTSSDGIHWFNKTMLLADPLASQPEVWKVFDDGTLPSLAFVRLKAQLAGTNPSVNVRVTVCGRGEYPAPDSTLEPPRELPFSIEPLSARLMGSTAVYSDSKHNEVLGAADFAGIQVVVSDAVGTLPTFSFGYEESSDGEHWLGGLLLDTVSLSTTENNVFLLNLEPQCKLSQQRFYASLGGTGVEASARVLVTGRAKTRM